MLNEIIKSASKKIRTERIALGLTQEEFANFIDIKYATYKVFEQKGKISFEAFVKILIKLNKENQFIKFLDGFEFNEQKERANNKKKTLNISAISFKPIIKVDQKQIVLNKKIFGNELFYSVKDGHIYEIPNFINIILNSWNENRLMLLIKYFGVDRLKPHIINQKNSKLLKSFNMHIKYIKRNLIFK